MPRECGSSSGTRAGVLGREGRLRKQARQCPEIAGAGELGGLPGNQGGGQVEGPVV